MFQLLYKYLVLSKKVIIPGIGVFYIERKPAKLDFANKVFVSPNLQINYAPEAILTDNRMYAFLAREQKIDEPEAVSRYHKFANNLKEDLSKHSTVELPGLGVLKQNAEGELSFAAIPVLKDYFPAAVAERILREHVEHNVLVGDIHRTNTEMKEMLTDDQLTASPAKDYWWIFAIGLGIIGIATIVYYYLHNGTLR